MADSVQSSMAKPGDCASAQAIEKVENHSDRLLGALVHVSSIPWPLLGPLVGVLVFGKSNKFVRAHALQALLDTILFNCLIFLAMGASLTYSVIRIIHYINTNWADFSWQEFLARFLIGWILLAIFGLVNTVISLTQAASAWRGNWPRKKRKTALNSM